MEKKPLNLKSTFFSLLGYLTDTHEPDNMPPPLELEQVRQAMLEALGTAGCERYMGVARQIRYAADVQGLWYARSELMAALSALHGETHARTEMARLTPMFRGLVPHSMTDSASRRPR